MLQHSAERAQKPAAVAARPTAAAQDPAAQDTAAQQIAELRVEIGAFKRKQEAELGRVVQQMGLLEQHVEREGQQVQVQLSRYGAAFASFTCTLGQVQPAPLAPGLAAIGADATTASQLEEQERMQLVRSGSHRGLSGQDEVLQRHWRSAGTQGAPGKAEGGSKASEEDGTGNPSAAKRARLQRGSSDGREGSNAVSSLAGSPYPVHAHRHPAVHAPTQREPGEAAERPLRVPAADRSAGSGTAATRAWKVESRAVSIVETWLGEIVAATGKRSVQLAVERAAAGLHKALACEDCPVSCVVAGFETALLECAAPRGLGGSSALREEPVRAMAAGHAAIEEAPFTTTWCRQEVLQSRAFSGLLLCAQRLHALLSRRPAQQQPQGEGLLELLQRRLHLAAAQPLLQRVPAPLDTQACSGAAAVATLYRMQGSEQVCCSWHGPRASLVAA